MESLKMNDNTKKIPELLAPAGTPEALDAAVSAGADAVYFGASAFNARMMAANFDENALSEAFRKCRWYGVRTNVTLNTLIHEREIDAMLSCAEKLYNLGADALIVADLGAAGLIHRYFPEMELHASTQAAGHNALAAEEFRELGFSRMVAARELSFDDLRTLCAKSPIETELFIHGAICVSQSGQCLASSMIGGRSGNRGECAQPCRLPYHTDIHSPDRPANMSANRAELSGSGRNKPTRAPAPARNGKPFKCGAACQNSASEYPLSLKDMCLANHVPELLSLGAASLKIEGRMKPPEYVYGVVSVWRRLLDEGRNATKEEMNELRALFSRSGFTDGYFTKKVGRDMLGVRTDADKALTASLKTPVRDYAKLCESRRGEVDISASFRVGEPSKLTMRRGNVSVSVTGQAPEKALNRPLTADSVSKSLTKLGGTPFAAGKTAIDISGEPILPLSALNLLRRDAVDALTKKLFPQRTPVKTAELPEHTPLPEAKNSASLTRPEEIPDDIRKYFELVYIPLERFHDYISSASGKKKIPGVVNGVAIPPAVFDSELNEIRGMLREAAENGIRDALVSNPGHIALAREAGMTPHGDLRLNIYNRFTADALLKIGFADLTASPELTIPQLRDLGLPFAVYGRLPLMTLEICAIRGLYSCCECAERVFLPLVDRKGVRFLLRRCYNHRNILLNSVPIWMCDRKNELQGCSDKVHFIFTDESRAEVSSVLRAWEKELPSEKPIRRLPK